MSVNIDNLHFKVHYPTCGCKYNKYGNYLVDTLDKTTKKYKHSRFETFYELKQFLDSKPYSVCLHDNTPENMLNGGVIFIVNNTDCTLFEAKFVQTSEIQELKFYSFEELAKMTPEIKEYHNFTPIKDSLGMLNCLENKELKVLICTQKDRDGNTIKSYPKGKRMLHEDSTECGIREFYEETGIFLDKFCLDEKYQKKRREFFKLDLPLKVRIFNCLFQIVIF